MSEVETHAELIDPILKAAGREVIKGSCTRREVMLVKKAYVYLALEIHL